jgi:hypothetical protein
MVLDTGFRLPRICLPRPGIDLRKWAVIACDQHTAEPEYWQQVAQEVGDAPSTLHLIFPEVYLGAADAPARIRRIQQTMHRYLAEGCRGARGAYVSAQWAGVGRGRAGARPPSHRLLRGSSSLVRPTEARYRALARRIEAARRQLVPHPGAIGALTASDRAGRRARQPQLYETEPCGGGRIAGMRWRVRQRAVRALHALADPRRCRC